MCQCGVFGLLIDGKAQPEGCLDVNEACITIVSAVLLLLGVEKKMWQISVINR